REKRLQSNYTARSAVALSAAGRLVPHPCRTTLAEQRRDSIRCAPDCSALDANPRCRSMTQRPVSPLSPPSSGRGEGTDAPGRPPTQEQPARADSAGQPGPGPGVLDGTFVVFVCALAFLLASTPARNSDLWLHLASGRWLVQGHSPRGTDPFTSTAANVFWVNHTWLGDVLL